MPVRKIIKIDEEKCTGCGQCVIDCAEGALKIVEGKAKVIKDSFCDGLGACIGSCPEGALEIIERDADEFDEEAVEKHLARQKEVSAEKMECGCPSTMIQSFSAPASPIRNLSDSKSELTQWPVQLRLLPPSGSLYENKNLMLIADCVAVAFPALHSKLIKGNTIVVTCPKLDDMSDSIDRLTEIFKNPVNSITCAIMEVPCCSGLLHIVEEAQKKSKTDREVCKIKISIKGEILEDQSKIQ